MTGWLRGGLAALAVLVVWLTVLGPASGETTALAPNFQETTVFSGLDRPVAVRFASDGRVFVMEKNGTLKEFDSLTDTTPTTVYQFQTLVDDYWDRGPLGLALDPNFPANPYIYILYAFDAPIGGTAPVWNDSCPTPPGATSDGCVISTRLSRLTISGNTATNEQVLINSWCQQYPSHSAGDLFFGADGALYVTGGDGASFDFADYGQGGGALTGTPTPRNPCGDPPGGVGGSMTPPSAEGGALRSQSPRRAAGEPVLLNGALLRVDPATGNGLPNNPFASSTDANKRRIVAYGMRNPFRFTIRPGTNDVWIGDVGWNSWEEIDRQPSPTTSAVNFGWPCYEGNGAQSGYQSAGLSLCTSLYSGGTATAPYYTYNHGAAVVSGDGCPTTNGSSITGLAFYNGGSYPSSFSGALFFADYTRGCIWVMKAGSNGLPATNQISVFDSGIAPVDLEIGPGGDLFFADLNSGTIRRISYTGGNNPPVAVATGSPTSGQAPLTVNFDGSGSSDPDAGDTITYSWDLNGDGTYGDSTAQKPSFTYSTAGSYTVRLKVTDNHGASTISAPITITVTSAGTATFGTTTPGASTDTASADYKEVSKYTAPSAVSVVKLTGYVSGLGAASGSQKVRGVIYADSSGNPGSLLGVSNEVVIPAGKAWAWTDFTFPSAVSVPAGTVWMGYIASSIGELTQLRYDSVANELHYNINPGGYAAGPTNPFGSPILSNKHYSLYATYTTGGGGGNNPPTAVATGSPTSGTAPLTVNFDGSGSSDPDAGDTITYSWDLNGDGTYGDSTAQKPSFTYSTAGTYSVRLKVTDNHGASTISAPITITVTSGGPPPSGTFGVTPGNIGFLADAASVDNKEVSKYTAPAAGNVSKLTGYVSGLGAVSGSQPVRAVIYADNGGSPGALLGVSNQVTVTAGQAWAWVDFTFPSAVAVPAGTVWMGYIAGATNDLAQLRYDTVSGDLRYNVNTGGYAGGATNPFGNASTGDRQYTLYATFASSGNSPPVPTIASPTSTLTYNVGDTITFSGSATDAQDGTLPASGLSWKLIIHHCPTGQGCHTHDVQTWPGVSSGSVGAPDHDYPSFLELILTATDSGGATALTSVMLQPKTVNLTFQSAPAGLQLTVGSSSATAPFTRTVIVGSANSVSAPTPQTLGGTAYTFSSWSDGGAQTHNITAPAADTTYTATYTSGGPPPPGTFGTTTIGASIDTASANYKEVSKYTSPGAVNVSKLTGYISGLGAVSGSQPLRAVIYADNNGSPGALLGVSNQVTVSAGQAWAWVDFTFSSAVAVPAGTVWMGYIAGATNDLTQLRYDTATGDLRYNVNTGGYAGGATNPFGTTTTSNKHYSLYATYS